MDFRVGDRVRSIENWSDSLRKGELGTVIGQDCWGDPMVHWDEFSENRHSYDGEVPEGHGWYINKGWIELVEECDDLGELPENNDIKFLFGDDNT